MTHPIYHLRQVQLEPTLQRQLAPFIIAHRPHTTPPSRATCKVEGEGNYFPPVDTVDEIKEQASMLDRMYYSFLETVTRDSNGNFIDD